MSKKILMSVAPLFAVAAFAISPAAASAVTTYGTCAPGVHSANCPAGEKFTAFAAATNVVSFNKEGTSFKLENVAKTADIECGFFAGKGKDENVGGIGKSTTKLVFAECKGGGELAACVINPPSEAITGNVTDTVETQNAVKVKITNGFNVKCGAINLGEVTGEVTGTQATATNVLVFTNAGGLTFNGAGATITGTSKTLTEEGLKVYI